MEVTIKPERKDYFAFIKYISFVKDLTKKIYVVFVLSFCFEIILRNIGLPQLNTLANVLIYLLLLLIVSSIFFFTPYLIAISKVKKMLAINNKPLEEQKIILTNEGIEITSGDGDIRLSKYNSIKSLGINNHCIYFLLFGDKYYIIPIRSFNAYSDAANFYGFIRQELSKIHLSNKIKYNSNVQSATIEKNNTPKYLYFLGLLGLIPLIGGIAGIILILLGIIAYKDKMLVLTGLVCILLTLCVFAVLMQKMNSNTRANMYKDMALSQLDGLVKDIEFYKMQHGAYPDSLQQVNKDNKFVLIFDPMAENKPGKKGTPYHYQKIGNKYTLFSVGVDGIPYTDDDIYPTTGINDTAKFGLIKVR